MFNSISESQIIFVKGMYLENELNDDQDNFDNLLDFSGIMSSRGHLQSMSLYDLSITKDKLNLSEKERTREESYEEIVKKLKQAKVEQTQLKQDLQVLQQQTYQKYLGLFQDEFQQLSKENRDLRRELNCTTMKIRDDRSERLSNRSSIKVKSSVNSVYGDQNRKTHSKISRNQVSPNMILKKKDPKLTESTAHLGRSQVHSPKYHKRRESQLTERKNEENNFMGISFNGSYNDDKASEFNMKESVSRQCLKGQPEQKNIFIQILSKMLKEEQNRDHQKYGEVYLQSTRKPIEPLNQDLSYINTMEQQIRQSNQKLEMLQLVMNRYQNEIEDMNLDLKSVEDLTSKLYQVKGRYVQMENKCQTLLKLKEEVTDKENILTAKKVQYKQKEESQTKNIASIETLIKIFTNNASKCFNVKSSKLYCLYYREIKELFKVDQQYQHKRQQKLIKVKEMIDNIRENRRKFSELIHIYEGRITKLEEKISRVKQQGVSMSAKSNRK